MMTEEQMKEVRARAAYRLCPECGVEKPLALHGEVFCRACEWSVVDDAVGTDVDAALELALSLDWSPVLGPAPGMVEAAAEVSLRPATSRVRHGSSVEPAPSRVAAG